MDSTLRPEDLRGKRYIAYARCASQRGPTQSLRRQIRLIRRFGDRMGMRCVDEVRHPGVGGLAPLLRQDLRALLARKRTQDDYDLLVMENTARLTRADGAGRLEALFMLCGVQIIYAANWRANGLAARRHSERPLRRTTRRAPRRGASPVKPKTARPR